VFKCQKCNKVSRPKEPSRLLVVETREHIFPFRKDANLVRQGPVDKKGGVHLWRPKRSIRTSDRGGKGFQIVREMRTCGECAEEFEKVALKVLHHLPDTSPEVQRGK
jgi:hypothetical protein